ncbi:MAG: phosphoglucosamine mutase [Acidimicrobiaceae bacterium]
MRGVANVDLTPELVVALGRAAARVLGPGPFVLGRDPRASGPMLEAALIAGLCAEGISVGTIGVVPTPAVAWACAHRDVAGAMISASHNPFGDNGIKLFASGGRKLSDEQQQHLEDELDRVVGGGGGAAPPIGEGVGTVEATPEDLLGWADSVVASIEGRSLAGLRLVVDCANGAASTIAPHVLSALGAELVVLHAEPDGTNINADCGSTYPADLQRVVVAEGADAGIAFDGDADRVLAVDATGELVDGDQIIAICALDLHGRGRLRDDTVVVTVMSNLGFRLAMAAAGVEVVETNVGDRAVLEALAAGGYTIGGEQSGHVIFPDLSTTGDGLLTAVQLLDVVVRTGTPLATLAGAVTRLPQVLRNVSVRAVGVDLAALIGPELARAEAELGDHGRVLIRPSGTEPVVRVMVEATTHAQAEAIANSLVAAVGDAMTAPPGSGRPARA